MEGKDGREISLRKIDERNDAMKGELGKDGWKSKRWKSRVEDRMGTIYNLSRVIENRKLPL